MGVKSAFADHRTEVQAPCTPAWVILESQLGHFEIKIGHTQGLLEMGQLGRKKQNILGDTEAIGKGRGL